MSVFNMIACSSSSDIVGPRPKLWTAVVAWEPLNLSFFMKNSLIHSGRDKMDAILQATFSSEFSWMKM